MSKTINQALADLVVGLGADPSVLSDNDTVSDYIEDLVGAIKGETADIIDDTEASETKTYSSSKIASLIPEDELPAVTSADNGKLLGVSSGAWGAVENKTIVVPITISGSTITIKNDAPLKTIGEISNALSSGKYVVLVEEISFGSYGKVFQPSKYGGMTDEALFTCIQNATQGVTFYYTQGLVISSKTLAVTT